MDFSKDSGPTTPLPDIKKLVFILDRLQKKDTYGVFSEPVDNEELPDYHDIIDHPMDVTIIRKSFLVDLTLTWSSLRHEQYKNLQKKDFENLRQESDDNDSYNPNLTLRL